MNAAVSRYLALGDSYTIGEGVRVAERWPVLLAQALTAAGMRMAAPRIVAETGWSSDELLAAIDAEDLEPPYDLVSLLIGVNNQYRGRDAGNYREELVALLAQAVALAGDRPRRVLVVSIPDWGVTPFAATENRDRARIAREIDAFNAIAREEAEAVDARFVDITGISRECGNDPAMLGDDGLHPSAAQYARWLPLIVAAARRCLAPI